MNTQGESSSSSNLCYDVFLSFRGEDTRKNFTGHLYFRLYQVGVNTFIDDEELRKGDEISIELKKAIEQSRVAIVVFSKNYASSSWCLDELVKILDCKQRLKQVVLPIFYDVDPSQVRRQTSSFDEALAKHKERLVGAERMEKWKAALTEAANLSGWDLRNVADGHESKFIESIIKQVLQEVNPTPLDVAHYPIGLDSPIKHIEVLLQSGCEHEVRMVGICGVGGIGKTTLAKAIYNRIFQQFDGSCFLSDIRSKVEEYVLVKLQEKLLHQILKTKEFEVDSVAEGVSLIKARLGSKKVLIILDDVDHRSQLESLTRERSWFGSGSVIIITTRDEHLLYGLTTSEIYRAKLLNDNEAPQLFSCHAFNCFSPPQEYVELAQDIIKYSGGLPLALVTLGSHLQGRSVEEWRYEFKKLRTIPHFDIQKILQISFDGLDDNTQSVFLDIACAFHGCDEDEVTKTLNPCGFYCETAIATLVKRHLLQRDRRRLVMHDLVRDMGREIVRMESPRDFGKRSRLVNPQEVLDVLQGNKGSENVEILVVERQALKGVKLNTKAFQKMINLRVLKIDDLHISGDFELLSKELRWLSWKECPLKCIPSNFPSEKLVVLNMKGSNIQEFGLNLQYCRNLKMLDLSDCKHLRRTPNFCGSRSLETLWLDNCSSLKEIHPSIGNLDRLTDLQLNGCEKITDLPSSICQLKSLEYLSINDCSSLQTLPVDIGDMQSLRFLNAGETGIKELPGSVEMLGNLIELEMGGQYLETKRRFSQTRVRPIVSLSKFISILCLPYCGFSEADVPRDIGSLSNLYHLDLSGNSFLYLPFDFSKLPWLKSLYLNDCENLQTLPSISNLEYLRVVELRNCQKLVKITGLDNLPSIKKMDMNNCTCLQNPFSEGFFSAPALSISCRKYQWYESLLQINLESNEIPDWCSNKVTAPSICLTMPTVHNNKFLGMVLWFVCRLCDVHELEHLVVTVSHKKSFSWILPFDIPDGHGEVSCVYYLPYANDRPFKGLNIKGGEQIRVEDSSGGAIVKKIGVHLLHLDQHGNVTTLPGVVDHSYTPSYPQRLSAGHINSSNNTSREIPQVRKIVKYPGEKELNVFKLLSKHIKGPLAARKFLDILLPLLSKRSKDPEICVGTLQIIKDIVEPLGSESSKKTVKSVSPLVISAGLDVRTSICDVLDAVAGNDSSVHPTANLLRELNATSTVELGDLDYDTVIAAYEKISADFFHTVPEEHALIILSHAIHDMSSGDLILRQSAYRLLLSFVEFSSQILDRELKSDQESSGAWVRYILSNFFLKHMGTAMNKEDTIQKVWIDLLRDMVLKLSTVEDFKSFAVLYSEDPEQDFFNNVVHLQRHRRARALLRFKNVISSGNLSKVLINKVFIPLLFKMLVDGQVGKGENIRSACLEAVGSISKFMDWRLYYALLNRCFREMTLKPDKQKVLLRLISSILDQFHFSEIPSDHVTKDSMQDIQNTSLIESGKVIGFSELAEIQKCLQKDMLPRVHKMLTADTDNLNVNISLILLKLLKLLPGDIMESHLPSIMHRIANFLKNRLESVRDEARAALAACLKELGLEYLQFVVKVLRGTLKRGFELHVLGFTLNFLLSKFLLNPSSGKLDYCLEDLLSIAVNDILSDVSEEKEVEKIASKMKETRKQKSYDTLKLIAQSITFITHALKLLAPILKHLQKQLTPKVKSKFENMFSHIASGIQCNPSINQTELFILGYGLIKDGIKDESPGHAETSNLMEGKQKKDGVSSQIAKSDKLVSVDPRYSHLITEFALGVLQNYMKNMKFDKKDEQLLSMLDPFVRLLGECLNSKYENVMSASLRCLSPLVRLPLPSLESQAEKIKNSLLNIAQGSVTSSNPLLESCVKLLTVLLRSTKITLSTDQLHMLIQFPLFVDLERNPSFVALSLLKAIVSRKLVVAEIYDIVNRVAELMVTSQVESIRKKSSQILLQFLLDYHISEKRLQQHLDFLLSNLSYEHSTGREAILEMLHAVIMKFPVSIIDEQSQTFFLHLVVCLANDLDNRVRSMTGTVIKLLVGRVSPRSLQSILEFSRSWYLGDKPHLWSAAAQVLGLLIEGLKDGFQKYIDSLLPVMRNILQSAVNVLTNKQVDLPNDATISSWKEAYYSLVLFEKILNQFPKLCFRKDLKDLWEAICELLLHPHLWLRNISNRLVACYFATVTEAWKENLELPQETYFLMRPSRLFFVATSLCCQLKVLQTDDAASDLITQNLVFSICSLHSFLGKNECKDEFWSTIEHDEQGLLLKAFQQLDSRKGKNIYLSLVSDLSDQEDEGQRYLVISYLLKTMGKISLHVEDMQMRIIFNCFKSVSPKLIDQSRLLSPEGEVDCQSFAYHMLLPLYKVCEGFAGKVISERVRVLESEEEEKKRRRRRRREERGNQQDSSRSLWIFVGGDPYQDSGTSDQHPARR